MRSINFLLTYLLTYFTYLSVIKRLRPFRDSKVQTGRCNWRRLIVLLHLLLIALLLECGPTPNVMAAQPNIGGAVWERSVIPLLVPRRKVWPRPIAGVPCINAAYIIIIIIIIEVYLSYAILPSIRSLKNINQFKQYIIRTLLKKYGYP